MHKNFHEVRKEFIAAFHNKEPVIIAKCMPQNNRIFFNVYSEIKQCESVFSFNINDADATPLSDIQANGLTTSIVGKLKFKGPIELKQYTTKAGKERRDQMRECYISDGTCSALVITFWADLVGIICEDQLIQISEVYAKDIKDAICLATTVESSVCFLTEDLACSFDNIEHESTKDVIECLQSVDSIKNVDLFYSCKSCSRRLDIQSGTGMCSCKCGRVYSIETIKSSPKCSSACATIEFINKDNLLLVATFFKEELACLLPSNVMSNLTAIKQHLLKLKGIDLHLNHKFIVTKFEKCQHT